MKAALDTDILLKGVSYGLLFEIIVAIPSNLNDVGVLGAAPFMVRNKLRKASLARPLKKVLGYFENFVEHVTILEPTLDDVIFAAEMEFAAQQANVSLDEGESQLCAIVISRAFSRFVTGDKRAVKAFEQLLENSKELAKLAGKVLCLEQLFLKLISAGNGVKIRDAVCREPGIDRTLAVCFSCGSPEVGPDSWSEGLKSYIADLRNEAKAVLAE